ncbi:MAG: phosphodiester glycosidase family protein [Deltaproteobacteria bacterium]|jgi:hypothetical protein|nr:phosphodiester glycosidase family protein [Deltaproteobacteria bacterium]
MRFDNLSMFRGVCQLISWAILAVFGWGALWGPAAAAGPGDLAEDFSGRPRLRELVWRLAGWLPPADPWAAGPVKRSTTRPNPRGGALLRISMTFDDSLSAWPSDLKLDCLGADNDVGGPKGEPSDGPNGGLGDAERSGAQIAADARPFGGPHLEGAEADFLEACLARALEALEAGPRVEPPKWRSLEPGLRLAKTKALYGARLGSAEVLLIKASPVFFRLAPYHEDERPEWRRRPTDVEGWFKRLDRPAAVVNGGQYFPDRSAMGLLRRDGRQLTSSRHKVWKGFLVQDPLRPERPAAALIDEAASEAGGLSPDDYGTVVQSYMMLDRLGQVRVRRTENLASRAVLGLDRAGDFVLVMAPGAMTLSDAALVAKDLGLRSALGLDGGMEAQWAVQGARTVDVSTGHFSYNSLGPFRLQDYRPTLPTVLALERRARPLARDGAPEDSEAD